jgi:hypothetical protein
MVMRVKVMLGRIARKDDICQCADEWHSAPWEGVRRRVTGSFSRKSRARYQGRWEREELRKLLSAATT